MDTMIDLTRLDKSQRVIVAGTSAFDIYLGLFHRGFSRVATSRTCRIACGQYDVALVAEQSSILALETLLVRIMPYLNARATIAVWIDADEHYRGKKLQSLLERLGFRIEAGAKCENGFAIAARRLDAIADAKAA